MHLEGNMLRETAFSGLVQDLLRLHKLLYVNFAFFGKVILYDVGSFDWCLAANNLVSFVFGSCQ